MVVYGFEGSAAHSGTAEHLPPETRGLLDELEKSGELTGKAYECTLVHHPVGLAAGKLLVIGAGKKEKFNAGQLRRLSGAAVRHVRARGMHEMSWLFPGTGISSDDIQSVVEGAILADYDADTYRTERNGERRIDRLVLADPDGSLGEPARTSLERGRIIAEAQNFTRSLVNEPSNAMTPTILAQRAQEMAVRCGLECEVLGPEKIRELKMGAFWAVAQGSRRARQTDRHSLHARGSAGVSR